jgi:hypothetical protein
LTLGLPGKAVTVFARRGEEGKLLELVTDVNRMCMQAENRQPKRAPSTERFENGLLLLKWIEYDGKGKLTKELVTEIKKGCKDWPCVRAYQKHRRHEQLRNALRNLADDTRRALREGRLPAGWRVP